MLNSASDTSQQASLDVACQGVMGFRIGNNKGLQPSDASLFVRDFTYIECGTVERN
jgi:hypothetical protein